MDDMQFVDNPPSSPKGRGRSGAYDAMTTRLRDRPGIWALVFRDSYASKAYQIRHGKIKAFRPAGAYEAISRRGDDGGVDIYARYVGEDGTP